MRKMNIVILVITILIPLAVGAISAFISAKGMASYGTMNKPPLSPPSWAFPVAWTILYIMMGLASYFIIMSEGDSKKKIVALVFYGIQLVFNFFWSLIFFNTGQYLVAFIWLVIMFVMTLICGIMALGISRISFFLLLPYLIWLGFAGYLNMGAVVLNMNHK